MHKHQMCIIDDHKIIGEALKFLLDTVYGIKVKTYHDPLLFFKKFSSDWRGCILIDLFMPVINGIDLMKKIKEFNPHVTVIIMSGHGDSDVTKQALEAGAHAFLTKPFKIEELLSKLKMIVPTPPQILSGAELIFPL